ncbi:MAG: DUF4349 domain-containing protein [Anaerolineales bacterium]|nr:DUF4349 domain-containing protein [Anaerolineales bacterium]
MRIRPSFFPLVLVLALVLIGCSTNAPEMVEYMASMPEPAADYAAGSSGESYRVAYTNGADWETQAQEQLVIRNANLSIVVKDTEQTMEAINSLVNGMGGWIVNSNLREVDDVKRGSISVRIPADQLDSFLDQVEEMANLVTNRLVTGEDVTDEYVDIQAQLTNLEATRDRVRNFLDQAKNVEEALQVNDKLSQLEGEIERLTGRKQYLEKSASYSQVSIDITPDELYQPIQVGRWQPVGKAVNAIEALIKAIQFLIDLLIYIVLFFLPLGLIIFGPIYLVVRFLRKRRARRSKGKEHVEEKEQKEV